jgi:uncharacterized MnhB-related membrane protein
MSPAAFAFDGLLCLTLLFIAWRLVGASDLFLAIMLFFVFGLLMSVAWVRLNAVDVALAEAVIGAGLTGALFLAALSRLRKSDAPAADRVPPENRGRRTLPEDPEKL